MAGTSAALSQPHLSVVDGHFTGSPWPPLKADAKATTRLPEQTRGFRRMTKTQSANWREPQSYQHSILVVLRLGGTRTNV